jgi:hypothetical protein
MQDLDASVLHKSPFDGVQDDMFSVSRGIEVTECSAPAECIEVSDEPYITKKSSTPRGAAFNLL